MTELEYADKRIKEIEKKIEHQQQFILRLNDRILQLETNNRVVDQGGCVLGATNFNNILTTCKIK